ncbi:MAG: 30S ribosomal protein S16 [Gemmatimonadetes bacterium]|nr:30S ribosomal protein S16 [Gemmatimonadota bacterium]
MVRLRLRRMGAKKAPFFRVVAADASSPRDGRFIEVLGHYNPTKDPQIIELKEDRIRYWLGVGAQPSDTVLSLFRQKGLLSKTQDEDAQPADAESDAASEE